MDMDMDIETIIREEMQSAAEDTGLILSQHFDRSTTVSDTGLDSLGFAVLVVRLEQRLGYDPFVELAQAIYPRTFGEFIAVYEARARIA